MRTLAGLMETFLSGEDRSMALVDRTEGLLIESFIDKEMYEDLSPAVASYSPGGGEHFYDEEDLAALFRYALRRLRDEGEPKEGR